MHEKIERTRLRFRQGEKVSAQERMLYRQEKRESNREERGGVGYPKLER